MEVTPERVALGWDYVWAQAEAWQKRRDTENAWELSSGSHLAGDNKQSGPLRVSDCCGALLHAAIDHHHALASLRMKALSLHTFAGATLARASIESACLAIWILESSDRRERLLRSLRWNFTDLSDRESFEYVAMGKGPVPKGFVPKGFVPKLVIKTAERSRIQLPVARVSSTAAVKAADAYAREHGEPMAPLLYWKLASGFAHGRRWSSLAFNEREERETDDPSTVNLHLSMSDDRLLHFAFASQTAVELAVNLCDRRAAPSKPPLKRKKKSR